MDAEVSEGDVFWIPRYYPACQIASRWGGRWSSSASQHHRRGTIHSSLLVQAQCQGGLEGPSWRQPSG
ncbi:hypothetical protein MUK42_12715 [Musa troglodytarum]|uniref:Uncharacterized protein n=1 Tax=Musa troglodytarum TaxID=320322 RepID=A0A9E7I2N5_9LILI|nr:hypothetical protein MUK42_12715 [Musa troglodytarum]